MQLKGKEKIIGVVLGVIVAIAGAAGVMNADDLKAGFCASELPAPAPVQVQAPEKK